MGGGSCLIKNGDYRHGLPCRPPPSPGLRVLQEVYDRHHRAYLAHQHTAVMTTDLLDQ